MSDIVKLAKQLGIQTCFEFSPTLLVPGERIRAYCLENKCGSYGNNYMCPPHIGTLEEIRTRLKNYERGVLLQYSKDIDVRADRKGVIRTKLDFHRKILEMEGLLKKGRTGEVWGLIGGNCGLCRTCRIQVDKPCRHPDKARPSLEAIGVDVLGLLDKLGLDNKFHEDKITWTGCVLYMQAKYFTTTSSLQ